jgi:hypothetical protein
LHASSLAAAEDYYHFYRDYDITQVNFSIDEAEGANVTSSFGPSYPKQRMIAFLKTLLVLAYRDG